MSDQQQDIGTMAVLETVYSYRLQGKEYGDLLSDLDQAITMLARSEITTGKMPDRLSVFEELETHFAIATQLDDRIVENTDEEQIQKFIDGPLACLAVDKNLKVLAISEAAKTSLGSIEDRHIRTLNMRDSEKKSLLQAIQTVLGETEQGPRDRLLFVQLDENADIQLCNIRPFPKAGIAILFFDHLKWNAFTDEALKRNFGLTSAETKVVSALMTGQRPKDIAVETERSVETVRSQIKSILSKTQLKDTTALVRLACEIIALSDKFDVHENAADPVGFSFVPPAPAVVQHRGQSFGVTDMAGIKSASPERTILFVHGLLQGPFATRRFQKLCHEQNLRVISPSRPGFGATPVAKDKVDFTNRSVDDMAHLLDTVKIDKAVIASHMIGNYITSRFAARHPDRIACAISISGVVPVEFTEQLRQQNNMQRIAMLAARYSPSTMNFIARMGERYLREGNERKCLSQIFARAPGDLACLDDPEIFSILKAGMRHLMDSGRSAFIHDCQAGATPFAEDFFKGSHKRHFIHGVQDRSVPFETCSATAKSVPGWTFERVENGGQNILHTHPEVIVECFAKQLESAAQPVVA
ncbi:alpha/beta fold hydrolase [Pseudahrensia aquimaris]|uniref:Alpha/beta fold hydrolase n=1 Tax=Pseudahrensia aquimaris TaxID=744461 RepID=A0ABW3FDN3_9HYPH